METKENNNVEKYNNLLRIAFIAIFLVIVVVCILNGECILNKIACGVREWIYSIPYSSGNIPRYY